MRDPMYGHVTLASVRNDLSLLVECTCGFRASSQTWPQAEELLASHDRFVVAHQGVDFEEQEP